MAEERNKRIAKNTFFLYGRKLVTLLIALYSSRLLLKYLGIDDFGLYGLVGSIVVIFNSLRGLFASSVQRFLNVQKESDLERQNRIFCAGMGIHFLLAVAFIVVVEIGGWILLPNLNIAPEKLSTAQWVLQFSILAAAVSIITVPFDAVLMARERFDAYALFSIIDSALRLGVIFLLVISPINRVIFYSILLLGVAITVRLINAVYCKVCFRDLVRFHLVKDRELYKDMTQFAGWNFFGNLGYSLTNEGVNLVLNVFGGIVANAARTVAAQVNNALGTFSRDINVTFVPQSMKAYAAGEKQRFYSLQFFSAKASLTIVLLIGVPVVALAPQILKLWLDDVPPGSVGFVRAIIFYLTVRSVHGPLDMAFKSANRLKKYQLCELSIMVMNIPVSWVLLYIRFPLYTAFIVMGVLEMVNIAAISLLARREIRFRTGDFCRKVLLPGAALTALSAASAFLIPVKGSGLIFTLGWAALLATLTLGLCAAILFDGKERAKLLDFLPIGR